MMFQLGQKLTRRRGHLPHCQCLWQLNFRASIHHSVVVGGKPSAESSHNHIDIVGPPDPVSNIRPLRLKQPTSKAEKEVQKLKLQMWALKHEFWSQHNTQFKREKGDFANRVLQRKRVSGELKDSDDVSQVTSEELSEFYKEFLDKNYEDQKRFTRNWIMLNWLLTWTQFRYSLKKLFGTTR